MTLQTTIPSYLYKAYQDDPYLAAFVNSYNSITQGYLDYLNTINLPIYTGLSGALLDWIGAGFYGYPRPILGVPSGAIFGNVLFNQATFGSGTITTIAISDDIYKRILTWKLHRGDGMYLTIPWLKKRIKRFLVGINGTSPAIGDTNEVSISITNTNVINIAINYPSDQTSVAFLKECLNAGILDLPFNYTVSVTG